MKKKKKGFTLIELIAAMFIMAILGSLILSLFTSSNRMLIESNSSTILQDEGRIVLDAIENDLKVAKKESIKKLADPKKGVSFEDKSGNLYAYEFDAANKTIKKTKDSGIEISTPTKNAESFDITYASNQYTIKMKLKKGNVEEEFISVIAPRNKQNGL